MICLLVGQSNQLYDAKNASFDSPLMWSRLKQINCWEWWRTFNVLIEILNYFYFNEVLLHITPPQEWVKTWLHLAQSTTVPNHPHRASTFLTHLFPVCCVNHLFYWLFKAFLFSIREPSDLSNVSLWLLPQKPKKWYLKETPVCLSITSLVQFYFLLHLIVQKSK